MSREALKEEVTAAFAWGRWDLPLLPDNAKRCYLPAWLLRARQRSAVGSRTALAVLAAPGQLPASNTSLRSASLRAQWPRFSKKISAARCSFPCAVPAL